MKKTGTLSNAALDLRPGGALYILNNGVVYTQNGFEAPTGANLNIAQGTIF